LSAGKINNSKAQGRRQTANDREWTQVTGAGGQSDRKKAKQESNLLSAGDASTDEPMFSNRECAL